MALERGNTPMMSPRRTDVLSGLGPAPVRLPANAEYDMLPRVVSPLRHGPELVGHVWIIDEHAREHVIFRIRRQAHRGRRFLNAITEHPRDRLRRRG